MNFKKQFVGLRNAFRNRNKVIEVSFSRLQAYQRCPWLYHLVYDEGWRAAPKGSMSLGLTLHRTLAEFLTPTNNDRSLNRLLEIYDQNWVNEGYIGTQETLDNYDSGRKMLEHYFEVDQKRTSRVVAVEATFRVDLNGIQLWGTVDRIDQAPDGFYEVIEYKTQGEHWNSMRLENDLQMTLYEWGVREGMKFSPIRLKYYFLSTGEYVEVKRSQQQTNDAMKLVNEMAHRLRREEFEPKVAYCVRCEFGSRCNNYVAPLIGSPL